MIAPSRGITLRTIGAAGCHARPTLISVEGDHPHRALIFAVDEVLDNCVFVAFALIGFPISTPQTSKIIENEINGYIVLMLLRSKRAFGTHYKASRLESSFDPHVERLEPASAAVPSAAKHQNDDYNDDKRGGM
jgi:hypothetical protein